VLAIRPAALFDSANDCMMPVMLNAIATTAAKVSSSIAVSVKSGPPDRSRRAGALLIAQPSGIPDAAPGCRA
jgi:hypothetical protein